MEARRSRRQRSRNASTAAMGGHKSNAIAVKPKPASRSNTSDSFNIEQTDDLNYTA